MLEDILMILWLAPMSAALAVMLVVTVRASRLGRTALPPIRRPEFDQTLAEHASESLSRAIGFETFVSPEPYERSEWLRLREYLKSRYPLFHEALSQELVVGYSLLYRWPGQTADEEADIREDEPGTENRELPLLFCAHLDVVPASGEWTYPPFSGKIADGYVWGRGAINCKNVIICLMEAVENLISQGFRPKRDIYFAFGHDKESGGSDGASNIAELFLRRGIKFEIVLDGGGALSRGIMPVGRPVAEVCVAEKGTANYRITAYGTGGHASAPPRHTSLGRLSEAIARVEFRRRKACLTPVVLDSLKALAPVVSCKVRMYLANLWLFKGHILRKFSKDPGLNALIRTTVTPTMSRGGSAVGALPGHSEAVLNARILHGDDENALLAYLKDLTSGLGVTVEMISSGEPSAVADYHGKGFPALFESIQTVFGGVPTVPSLSARETDARFYEPFCGEVFRFMPFILTPGDHESIYGADERVLADALGAATRFYMDFIKRLA